MRTTCEHGGRAPVNLGTSRKQPGMIFSGSKLAPLSPDHASRRLAAEGRA